MMPCDKRKLVQSLTRAHELGLRRKFLPTPIAGEPEPLDVVEQHLGLDARDATQQLLSVIDEVFDGLAASVSCGGSIFILHNEYVAQWLVDLIELGDNPGQAVDKFYEFNRAKKIKGKIKFFIDGIEIDGVINISDSINIEKAVPQDYFKTTAEGLNWLRVNYGIGTVCLSMDIDLDVYVCKYKLGSIEGLMEYVDEKKQDDVQKQYNSATNILFQLTDLLCIIAVGPVSIRDIVIDWDVNSSPLALIQSPPKESAPRRTRANTNRPRKLGAQTCKRVLSTYLQATDHLLRTVQIPIFRLNQYFNRFENVEAAIDLGIALEVLFVSDRDSDAPIGYLLRVRGAVWIGGGAARRRSHLKILRNAYGFRSKAAHTGAIEKSETAASTMERAAKLAVVAIRKMLRYGGRPENWDDWLLTHSNSNSTINRFTSTGDDPS